MDSPFIRADQSANSLRLQDHIDRLSMFNPMIARMRAEQKRIEDMKHEAAVEISHRFAPVTPGRKPLWAKIEEETVMCYEEFRRMCEHSTRSVTSIEVADIIEQYRRLHPDPESEWHVEPAIRHNIFREYYYRTVKQYPVLDDNVMVLLGEAGNQACVSGGLYKKMKKAYDNNKLR